MLNSLQPFDVFCAWGYDSSVVKMLDRLTWRQKKIDVVANNIAQIKGIVEKNKNASFLGTSIIFLNVTFLNTDYSCSFFVGLLPFANHKIYKHERTHACKIDAYEVLMNQYQLQVSPIMLLRENSTLFDQLSAEILKSTPVRSYTESDLQFDVYTCTDANQTKEIQKLSSPNECFFLADGHHRLSYYEKHDDINPLCMVAMTTIEQQKMTVCPRALHCPSRYSAEEIFSRLSHYFDISESIDESSSNYVLVWNKKEYTLRLKNTFKVNDPLYLFSSFVTDEIIFKHAFGYDPLQDPEVRGITGSYKVKDAKEILIKLNGKDEVLVFPPLFDKHLLLDHAADNFFLPSTSTCFSPKIPDGLIVFDSSLGIGIQ